MFVAVKVAPELLPYDPEKYVSSAVRVSVFAIVSKVKAVCQLGSLNAYVKSEAH